MRHTINVQVCGIYMVAAYAWQKLQNKVCKLFSRRWHSRQEIWADAYEMRESLKQFLFADCQSISSHFITVHS